MVLLFAKKLELSFQLELYVKNTLASTNSSVSLLLLGVKEFCENIELERSKTVNLLSRKYADIGPLITKIEHLILETSTGKAKCMTEYYTYWEHRVLDSLIKMVQR